MVKNCNQNPKYHDFKLVFKKGDKITIAIEIYLFLLWYLVGRGGEPKKTFHISQTQNAETIRQNVSSLIISPKNYVMHGNE